MLGAALAGACLAYFGLTALIESDASNALLNQGHYDWPLVLGGWLFAVWVAITIHEVGHLAGAVFGGLSPLMLFSGPLHVTFQDGKAKYAFNRHQSTWGGLAVAIPQVSQSLSAWQAIATVAGGPMSSLLTAAGFLVMSQIMTGMTSVLCMEVGVMSAVIGVGTLIPLQSGGFASDGKQLWQLMRRDRRALERLELSAMVGRNLAGHRPADWDLVSLEAIAQTSTQIIVKTSARVLVAQVLDDRSSDAAAHAAFEALAKEVSEGGYAAYPKAFRAGLALPIAIYLAQRRGDAEAAQRWLDVAPLGVEEPHERLHAKAAICAARGEFSEATTIALQAIESLAKSPPTGLRTVAIERLNSLIRKIP